MNYRKPVTLNPGLYQIRIAVREESTGRIGSASSWIEVPDIAKKKLTLSSIILLPGKIAEPLTPRTGGDSVPNQAARKRPARVSRRFHRGDHLDFHVEIYNAHLDDRGSGKLSVRKQIFSGSKLINISSFDAVPTTDTRDGEPIPYAARLSLASFPPGEYELRLEVVDAGSKTTAFRSMNFTVEE